MKNFLKFLFSTLLLAIPIGHAQPPISDEEIYYYHQGQLAARRLQKDPPLSTLQIEKAIEGFSAQLKNQPPAFTQTETQQAVEHHHEQSQARQDELSQQNLIAGEKYLLSLESNPDYRFLDFGLAYKINKTGSGNVPRTNSQVRLKYVGKHLNGQEFDRSDTSDWLPVQSLLPGWRVALMKMPAGSLWTVVIPHHMAYGERGAGRRIGPHETLIYDLQLLNVK